MIIWFLKSNGISVWSKFMGKMCTLYLRENVDDRIFVRAPKMANDSL